MPTQLSMILTQVQENREAIRDLEGKVSNHMVDMEGRVTLVESSVSLRTRIGAALIAFLVAAVALAVRFL